MSDYNSPYMQSNSGGMTLYSLGTKFNLSHAITLFICNLIQGAKLVMVQALYVTLLRRGH